MPNRVHNGVCSIMFLPGNVAERATMTWLSDRHSEMFVVGLAGTHGLASLIVERM
jgi:hypothetical protein